jgi:hypothetical protein
MRIAQSNAFGERHCRELRVVAAKPVKVGKVGKVGKVDVEPEVQSVELRYDRLFYK